MSGYIGLDIGTTGVKSSVFDQTGKVYAYAYEEYALNAGAQGEYELDPNTILAASKRVIRESVKKQEEKIAAISITSFGESVVLLDACRRPLCPSMIYMDKRGQKEALQLEDELGTGMIARTAGLKPHAMYTLPKLWWLKNHRPQVIDEAKKICFIADFVALRLGAEHMTDYSLASRSMGLDIQNREWWPMAFEKTGLDQILMPKLTGTGSVTGKVSARAAEETGLTTDTLIIIGGHDQVANALGAGVVEAGQAINGIGTVDCITPAFTMPANPAEITEDNYCIVPYIKEGLYVAYAFNMSGGALLRWFRDNFAVDIAKEAKSRGKSPYDIISERIPKEPSDLLVLPYFAGSSTPRMDVEAKGAILGLTLKTDRYMLYRAILEGESYEMMLNMECLQKHGVKISELRTVGGGSRSGQWMQIRADIFERRVLQMQVEEAGTLGCAIMAGVATGEYRDFDEGCRAVVKPERIFEPQDRFSRKYREQFARYSRTYDALKTI